MEAVDACRYFSRLLAGALTGAGREALLSPRYCPVEGHWDRDPLVPVIDVIAGGSFKDKTDIKGMGYIVDTLEAALWAFHHTRDFQEVALRVVNLGDDADTTDAVYGQLAGAYYGVKAIPAEWRDRLAMQKMIESMADTLYQHAMLHLGGSRC